MNRKEQPIDTASSLASVGRYGDAEAVLRALDEAESRSPAVLLLRARVAAQQGNLHEADLLCREMEQMSLVGDEAAELARLRAALNKLKERHPMMRHLPKLLAATALLLLCLAAGAAYWMGHRAGVLDARAQVIQELSLRQSEMNAEFQRQDRALKDLVQTAGDLRRSLELLEDRQSTTQRVNGRRLQQIEKQLRAVESAARVER